jgi:hypothetical protein
MRAPLTRPRVRAARAIAVAADLLQVALLPAFLASELSLVNQVIDVAVAVVLVALVGWHWAFLPTFLAEMVPFVDLIPTWTAAVFIATGGRPAAEGASRSPAPPGDVGKPPLPPGSQTPRDPSGS